MRNVFALLLIVWAGGLSAGTLYDCEVVKGAKPRGWISPRVALVLQDNGQAITIDSITLHFLGRGTPVKLSKSGNTLKWRWTVRASDSIDNRTSLRYRAQLDTKTRRFSIRARPVGYANDFSGKGSCTIRENITPRQLQKLLRGS